MSLFVVNRYLGEEEKNGVDDKNNAKSILERINKQAKRRKKLRESGAHEIEKVIIKSDTDTDEEPSRKPKKKSDKTSLKKPEQVGEEAKSAKIKKRKHATKEEETDVVSKKSKTKKEKDFKIETEDSEIKTKKIEKVKTSKLSDSFVDITDNEDSVDRQKRPKKKKKTDQGEASVVLDDADVPSNELLNQVKVGGKKKKKRDKNIVTDSNRTSSPSGGVKNDAEDTSDENDDEDGEEDIDVEDADADGEPKSDLVVDADDEVLEEEVKYGSHDFGGYTVLGEVREAQANKVKRVLPDWLAHPSVVSADIRKSRVPLEQVPGLSDELIERLKENSVQDFFPVQADLIPAILKSSQPAYYTGIAGYRPHDICCSSPTGSGKTLAFVLPIVQALQSRVSCQIRALAVLPVRDLATQVYKVFQTYCQNTPLQVGLLTGQKTFALEQQSLIKQGPRGLQCQKDIIIATPGRLVDHINKTPGFNLEHLRFLVIDEADRMMDEIKQDWLHHVETAFLQSENSRRNNFTSFQAPLTVRTAANMFIPPQKLLFSATLSQNPEKLQQLNLFQPKLFTSVMSKKKRIPKSTSDGIAAGEAGSGDGANETVDEVEGEFVGKYTTPSGLSEFFLQCPASQRPLYILHLLHNLNFRQVLCFTNSIESTHRLYLVVKLFGGLEVREFSSNLHSGRRARLLKQFEAGKIDMLICSDAMARGMDVDNVRYVISYEPPPFIKTYIHRIGRTARAGRPGSAFTLLEKKEVYHFKQMLKGAGKEKIEEDKATKSQLKKLVPKFEEALQKVSEILKAENEKKHKKKR